MKKVLLTLIASIVCINVATAATLTPKKGVSILYINGFQAEDKVGKNHLEKGYNQIVIRMDKDLSRGSSPAVFTSAPYVLNFEASGEYIVIGHPQARSEMEAMNVFKSEQPDWKLIQDGSALEYTQEKLPSKGGLFPYLAMDKLLAEYNQSKGVYFEGGKLLDKPVEVQVLPTIAEDTASRAVKEPAASSNLDQLKAWYLKASKQERKEFRKWMIDQE
jgi:hypothetical protein